MSFHEWLSRKFTTVKQMTQNPQTYNKSEIDRLMNVHTTCFVLKMEHYFFCAWLAFIAFDGIQTIHPLFYHTNDINMNEIPIMSRHSK